MRAIQLAGETARAFALVVAAGAFSAGAALRAAYWPLTGLSDALIVYAWFVVACAAVEWVVELVTAGRKGSWLPARASQQVALLTMASAVAWTFALHTLGARHAGTAAAAALTILCAVMSIHTLAAERAEEIVWQKN